MKKNIFRKLSLVLIVLMLSLMVVPYVEAALENSSNPELLLQNGVNAEDCSKGEVISAMMHLLHKQNDTGKKDISQYAAHEKIMVKNASARTLELEYRGTVALADNCAVYQIVDNDVVPRELNNVLVGAENVYTFFNKEGLVQLIVIYGDASIRNIRVGITDTSATTLEHGIITVQSKDCFKLVDKKAEVSFDIEPNIPVSFTNTANSIVVTKNGVNLYSTMNRLYLLPANENSYLQLLSINRNYGKPNYRGFFEITPSQAVQGKLRLINELPMEKYLYQVVPSEMPASFGLEALKAQAVAARTYAINECVTNASLAKEGIFVYDGVMSQVYNNSLENALTIQAVDETNGLILMKDGRYVDCRYYSTSGGYGASAHEVWADAGTKAFPGTPIPYLIARSYTYDPANNGQLYTIDTSNEEAINAFYKNLSFNSYDSSSYYFRWKVSLSKQELENTINKNIGGRYFADPTAILTKNSSGEFASMPIPAAGVGSISNMYASKRGAGGNMMELVIEGSTGTYKILKEYNIRFTIRPNKASTGLTDVIAYRAKGGSTAYDPGYSLKNPSILYSAFCTFDIDRATDNSIQRVTFYGGGNGHGVGMSQYGASMLGLNMGYSFNQILSEYYMQAELVNMYDIQDNSNIHKGIFKKLDSILDNEPVIIEETVQE